MASLSVACDKSVVFSTNKTDRYDKTEVLLKVALNTINQQIYLISDYWADDTLGINNQPVDVSIEPALVLTL